MKTLSVNHNDAIQAILDDFSKSSVQYAFYFEKHDTKPFFNSNCDLFPSASLIKVPILLAWVYLERAGIVDRHAICKLDDEPQIAGSGFARIMLARQLPYQDVLLMMIAVSDNLCTNLIIRRVGLERLNQVFRDQLGLQDTLLQRRMMDLEARVNGRDNWISARDCQKLFAVMDGLTSAERAWVEPLLYSNQDDALLMRDVPRDTLDFYHKTGSIGDSLNDWGYTQDCNIFLLTRNVTDQPTVFNIFGRLGRLLISDKN
jgi:beta-lactamase class A